MKVPVQVVGNQVVDEGAGAGGGEVVGRRWQEVTALRGKDGSWL